MRKKWIAVIGWAPGPASERVQYKLPLGETEAPE